MMPNMKPNMKPLNMRVYDADTGNEISSTVGEIEINTQPVEPVNSAGLFGEVTLNTENLSLYEQFRLYVVNRLDAIRKGAIDTITTIEAMSYIKYMIDYRAPAPYWALTMLLQYAGLEITQYKWAPVDQRPHETLEHAYRRVQLGDTVVRDNTHVVLIPSAEYKSSNSDTLF